MKKEVRVILNELYPIENCAKKFLEYSNCLYGMLSNHMSKGRARIIGDFSQHNHQRLITKYSQVPLSCTDPKQRAKNIAEDFFRGVPLWRSPQLAFNVGAATNVASSSLYSIALDLNVFMINSELAGNSIAAEPAVIAALANMANISPETASGFFTFGGTATNLYAMKIALNKYFPNAWKEGLPKRIKIVTTEDAHFAHMVCADWLGIGKDNVEFIKAGPDRRSSYAHAEKLFRKLLKSGYTIPLIMLNGGTTYDHVVDNIPRMLHLRNKLWGSRKPHVHVDSVIGWIWLAFKGYEWKRNPLRIRTEIGDRIRRQYNRIRHVSMVDTWGIDFHKGLGGAPLPCSVIMMNNREDALTLSKKKAADDALHPLAGDYSFSSPVDYTLETSRPAGSAVAALGVLHTLGLNGIRMSLSHLLDCVKTFSSYLDSNEDMSVCNHYALGYAIMVRLLPQKHKKAKKRKLVDEPANITNDINRYLKAFFEWDEKNRLLKNKGLIYSFSKKYISTKAGVSVSTLKIYPVSAWCNRPKMQVFAKLLRELKAEFDSMNHEWKF